MKFLTARLVLFLEAMMSKKKRKANHVMKSEDYLNLFPDDKESKSERMRGLALKEAQDVRKFEIDLYWKRTGFFWAFITVIYIALFSVLCKYIDCPTKYSVFVPAISALSGLGFFFSVAWHMVNKGSKFWQKNWESHVSLLERTEIGPLYDVYLNPKGTKSERLLPTKAFDFSVTKVNMWASFTIVFCSLAGWLGIIAWLFWNKNENGFLVFIPTLIIFIFSLFLIFSSNGNSDIEISESENNQLNMIHIKLGNSK